MDAHAKERREYSDARKRRFATERRELRELQSIRDLILRALAAESLLSTVPAGSTERSRGGGSADLPRQHELADDPRYKYAVVQVRRSVQQLLDLQEEVRGFGVAAGAVLMLSGEKDEEILKLKGASPRDVVEALGREVSGGTRTVERVRIGAGCCRWCGQEMPGDSTGHRSAA